MTWDDITREKYKRTGSGYPSDMTDREWAYVASLLPPARRGGRPRTADLQKVLDGILYIASSGCQWQMLPKGFSPVSTVRGYFYVWRDMGLWVTINHVLVMEVCEIEGPEARPPAGVIDSQSVKTTESGGPREYDAGKKIKGRKHHIITDTLGLMLYVMLHTADIQDRDGAPDLLRAIRYRFTWLRYVFANGGYAGNKLRNVLKGQGDWSIKIIAAKGFVVPQRLWVVERAFAWIGRCRRLAKDWEQFISSATALAYSANVRILTRRLARYCRA